MDSFSLAQARAVAVDRQLSGGPQSYQDVIRRLGCIQIDTISAVRRAHELTLLSRGVKADEVDDALKRREKPVAFEHWGHALSLIDLQLWPYLARRRRSAAQEDIRSLGIDDNAVDRIRELLQGHGSITSKHLPDGATLPKPAGVTGWNPRSDHKRALDWMVQSGEVTCTWRQGFQRVYQAADEVIPTEYRWDADDSDCVDALVAIALRNLGVGTLDDIADYFRLRSAAVRESLERMEVPRVEVEGWDVPAWKDTSVDDVPTPEENTVPVSMFDPLVWHRARLRRLWGHDWKIEIYVPKAKRTFGYWCMPVVVGSRIPGRVALRRRRNELVVEAAEWSERDRSPLYDAVNEVASWTTTTPTWECGVAKP
ncbi:DNA glycosylase AlkZ-like family protein [Haloglycomyces albus]|uniref:DNA glycosylase AlkZ-like family protein n=1 Tax=Haloglycomyces albus TaxID=526067 RepID=UPI00046CC7AE|nr:crosslink repair DNA glycosylase YcaQ family protein [Haloglycomyces albus]